MIAGRGFRSSAPAVDTSVECDSCLSKRAFNHGHIVIDTGSGDARMGDGLRCVHEYILFVGLL